jgi:hypothetical protein
MSKTDDSSSNQDKLLAAFLGGELKIKNPFLKYVQHAPFIEESALQRHSVLLNQETPDPNSLIELLKEFLNYNKHQGFREHTQKIVNVGGKVLLDAINARQEFEQISKDLIQNEISYSAKYSAANHAFVIKTSCYGRQYYEPQFKKVKANSKTIINEKQEICVASTKEIIKDLNAVRYVVSKKGDLYININYSNPYHHTCFLKGKPEDELFGFGKPTACAGYISIQEGKITMINNHSGHYKPSFNQLKVVLHYFQQKDILDNHVKIEERFSDTEKNDYTINDIDLSDKIIGDILDNYSEVHY